MQAEEAEAEDSESSSDRGESLAATRHRRRIKPHLEKDHIYFGKRKT